MIKITEKERGYVDPSGPFPPNGPTDLLIYALKTYPKVRGAERTDDRALLDHFKYEIIIYMEDREKNKVIDLKEPVKKKEWLRQPKKNKSM